MPDCIFCKIAEGKIPADKVYEDDEVLAFEDVNPVAPVHILIIPKKHIPTLNDTTAADEPLMGKLLTCAKNIAEQKKLSRTGYRVVTNVMSGAGQSVFHIHVHLLGGRPFNWPPG